MTDLKTASQGDRMTQINKIQKAIKFATKTHEIYQKQKRKGRDVPYITHPLTVGTILASVHTSNDVICAGILHDTIEDSISQRKVTCQMLQDRFGENIARLVLDVTETDKSLSWEERKNQAREHIKSFSHDSILVKSADNISNIFDLIESYKHEGEEIFSKFHAPKEKIIENHLATIDVLINSWPESPLTQELHDLKNKLNNLVVKNNYKLF